VDFCVCVMDTTRINKTYAPSSYEALQSTLLMDAKTMVETIVTKVHSKNAKYRCIICSNGWNHVSKCPLINVMSCNLFGDVFEKFIDINGETKMVQFLVNAIATVMDTIGLINIMQVCMNNVTLNQFANKLFAWTDPPICMHWYVPLM
jgi:hypothetical protein